MKAIVTRKLFDGARSLEDQVVLVDGSEIVGIGPRQDCAVPAGAEVILVEDGCAVPGLIDAHNHLWMEPEDFEQQSLKPDLDLFLRGAKNARIQLWDGVTTLRDCGTPRFVDLRLKEAIAQGLIPGPDLICAGQWITASHGHGAFEGSASIGDGPDDIRRLVRRTIRAGVDFVKVMVSGGTATRWSQQLHAYYGPEELRVLVEEAHDHGMQVAAHIHGGSGTRIAAEAGVDTIEHGSFITDDADIEVIARRGAAWMFNQGARMADPNPLLPRFEQDKLLRSREPSIIAYEKAKAAGIPIMAGADGYHEDHAMVWALEALVKTGATPLDALVAATLTPAKVLGLDDVGSLAAGKRADILVVHGDPLANISALRNVRFVMKAGKVYDGASRDLVT